MLGRRSASNYQSLVNWTTPKRRAYLIATALGGVAMPASTFIGTETSTNTLFAVVDHLVLDAGALSVDHRLEAVTHESAS